MTGLVVLFSLINAGLELSAHGASASHICKDPCRVVLVESIPEGLTYPNGSVQHLSVYQSWMDLLEMADNYVDIASSYWTMRSSDLRMKAPSAWQGENVYKKILEVGLHGGVKIRIAQNQPPANTPNIDTSDLVREGAATVRSLNFTRFLGEGILHTKMWLIDSKHFYLGSANLDWRSLTQVKEVGVVVYNCSCLAQDMSKLFQAYWYMGAKDSSIPAKWPTSFSTNINRKAPLRVYFNKTLSTAYLASSPPQFCADGRTSDIDALLGVIQDARSFVYIAVMDYSPTTLYNHPRQFWPVIDDALRKASLERGVEVRILASYWKHTFSDMPHYLRSLQALNNTLKAVISTKLFIVPAFNKEQKEIPYARVNHNKYMVTDNTAYIGTSNWSGDYFQWTGGLSIVIQKAIRNQLEQLFRRDWSSRYAHPITGDWPR